MSAIATAVQRGKAEQSKKPKWEPVGVDYPGWLTARIEDLSSGEIEGVFFAQGKWQFRKLGHDKEGNARSYNVPAGELKRIAKAMLNPALELRDELIRECVADRRAKMEDGEDEPSAKRARRKRQ